MGIHQIKPRTKGILLVLCGGILWGASGVAAQYLLLEKAFSPEWLVVVRMITAGSLLLGYDYKKNNGDIFPIWKNKHDRRQLILFGFVGMFSVQYTYFLAIQYSNAATATILAYLMPTIIVVYFACRTRHWPSTGQNIALFLAMLGTYLLVTKGDFTNLAISPAALFWGVASAFSGAFYTVQPKYLLSHYRSPLVIGWSMLVVGIAIIPINPPWQFVGIWDYNAFGALAFIIIFGTVIAFYAYLESIRYIHPSETGTIASVEPLAAVFLSVYLLNTPFGYIDCLGGLCIISTVFILARTNASQ